MLCRDGNTGEIRKSLALSTKQQQHFICTKKQKKLQLINFDLNKVGSRSAEITMTAELVGCPLKVKKINK